jgi:hypothetical protein
MLFRQVVAAINQILADNAAGEYTTIAEQQQTVNAKEVKNKLRRVQAFYRAGDFPPEKSSYAASTHVIQVDIIFYVAEAAEGDLSILNNPASTPAQRATALGQFVMASKKANDSMDDLLSIVYSILTAAENSDLGLPYGTISNLWIDNFRKDDSLEQGDLFVLTGSLRLTCQVSEDFAGETGTAGQTIDTVIDIKDDDVEKTGIIVNTT